MNSTETEEVNFGAELYRLRIALGLSQTEVSEAAGITRGYYSLIENSRKPPPPLGKVRRIAEALRLSPDDFRYFWGLAAIERSRAARGEQERLHCGPPELYVIWNGLALGIPKEEQLEIEAILKRKNIM